MPVQGRASLLAVLAAAVGLAVPGAASAAKVYFLQGEQVTGVDRPGTTVREAVQALVAGPTAAEAAQGFETYVPAGTPIRAIAFENGVATVDLGERFVKGRRADDLNARLTQLVYTVTEVPGVTSVRVLIKGGTPLGLFPGFLVTKPVTRKAVERPSVPPPVAPPTPPPGQATDETRGLQQRLADLGFLDPAGVDGVAGPQTTAAVIGFQKWARLGRDGVVGPATSAALAAAARPTPITSGSGRRVEVLLDRQLVLLIDGATVVRAIHVATGAAATPTPAGTYAVYRKAEKDWSVPFQVWLPWATYVVGGIAFHEYPDVPVSPASHGCIRVTRFDARTVYDFTPLGTQVKVLAVS